MFEVGSKQAQGDELDMMQDNVEDLSHDTAAGETFDDETSYLDSEDLEKKPTPSSPFHDAKAVLYVALMIAGVGGVFRLIFFKSWLALFVTIFILTGTWFVFLFIFLELAKRILPEVYAAVILGKESPAGDEFSEFSQTADNEIASEDVFNSPSNLRSLEKDFPPLEETREAEASEDPTHVPGFLEPRPRAPRKRVVTGDKEIDKIQQFASKDIAKAVKIMMGPDEDNPLIQASKESVSPRRENS